MTTDTKPKYLRLVSTGEIFVYTEAYAARDDMVPHDVEEGAAAERDVLCVKWKARFGKFPPPITKIETLREKAGDVSQVLVDEMLEREASA